MAFKKREHPLGWGDRELAYLVGQRLTMVNLYRAMGHNIKSSVVPASFKEQVKAIQKDLT